MKKYSYDEHDEIWDIPEEFEDAFIAVTKQIGHDKLKEMKMGELLELLYAHMRPPGDAKTDT